MMRQTAIRPLCQPAKPRIRFAAPQSSSPIRIVYDPPGKRKQACLAAALLRPTRCPKILSLLRMTQEPPPSPPIGQAGVARLLRAHLKRVGCWFGEAAGLIGGIEPASAIVKRMAADAARLLAGKANVTIS